MLKKDLVITEGLEKGIASSPHVGFEDIRNLDIISAPGSVNLNFALAAMNKPPTVSAVAFTSVAATDVLTVSSTSGWYNGMAVTLNTVVTSTGIATGRVYWVGDLSGNTFKLYKNPVLDVSMLQDVATGDGSGTISSYTMSAPLDKAQHFIGTGSITRNQNFILDDTGKVWWIKNDGNGLTTNLVYLGNDTLTGTTGRAIAVYNQDIVVFRTDKVDRMNIGDLENNIDLDTGSGWVYGFDNISTVFQARRPVLASQDGYLYFGNSGRLGRLDTDYTLTSSILDLPPDDDPEALGELGDFILIGGQKNLIYPWNKIDASFVNPIILPDYKVSRIVTANQYAFIFAGNRGRIYVTNGTGVEEYAKFPDHLTGAQEPYFTWTDAMTWRNQLYFSFTATTNPGVALTTVGGVWAYNIPDKALRLAHQLSYGSYAGSATVLLPHTLSTAPPGTAIYAGWSSGGSYGVDVSTSTYHTSYSGYFITPVHRIGFPLLPQSIDQIEYVLDKPLASGEGVRTYYRANRNDSFTLVNTFDYTTYGALQYIGLNFPTTAELVTAQFKIEVTGSSTAPSLKEVRLR